MSLTSQDETDLILPLYKGTRENPYFTTFLERLSRRTEADHVAIAIRRSGESNDSRAYFFAGTDLHALASERGIKSLHMLDDAMGDRLRVGRAYSVAEFTDLDPEYGAARARGIGKLGITDERVVRVLADADLSASLILARRKSCSAADSALLSNLSPYVALAVSNLVETERQTIEATMAAQGMGRTGIGWILFGSDARISAIDPATARMLSDLAGIVARPGERLREISHQTGEQLAAAAAELADNPSAETRPVILGEDPRVEALLMPAASVPVVTQQQPVMLALCRLPRPSAQRRPHALASLHELPRREAELAVALADGMSIAEAAEAMGLTLETARNYSKRLYAKLGVRGQAELVRLVYESSAVLA